MGARKHYMAFPLDEDGKIKFELVEGYPEAIIPAVKLFWDPRFQRQKPWPEKVKGWEIIEMEDYQFFRPGFLTRLRERYPDALIQPREPSKLNWPYEYK